MRNESIKIQKLNERNEIFNDKTSVVEHLKQLRLIKTEENCISCGYAMKIYKRNKSINGFCYVCINQNCRKESTLTIGRIINSPTIPLNDYLLAIYKWLENNNEKSVLRNVNISKRTYQKIKSKINLCCKEIYLKQKKEKIGGKNIKVQVDETVISHKKCSKCPSLLPDETLGLIWLVGFIEENSRNILYEIVPNRNAKTMEELFIRNLNEGSIIITDGHASYPSAVRAINGFHKVVNHSKCFKNEAGFHTNNIENLWSLLKYEIGKRKGIKFSSIENFLQEFNFRYLFLKKQNDSEISFAFYEILSFLFNKY